MVLPWFGCNLGYDLDMVLDMILIWFGNTAVFFGVSGRFLEGFYGFSRYVFFECNFDMVWEDFDTILIWFQCDFDMVSRFFRVSGGLARKKCFGQFPQDFYDFDVVWYDFDLICLSGLGLGLV